MWPILPASESSAPCRKFAIRERSCHQARQANVAPGTFFRAFLRTRCLNQGFRERTFSSQSRTTNAARPSSSSPNTGSSRLEPISKLVRRYSCATPGKISCTRSRYHLPFCANKTTSPTATSRSRTLCKTNSSPGRSRVTCFLRALQTEWCPLRAASLPPVRTVHLQKCTLFSASIPRKSNRPTNLYFPLKN